jgi:hypothetical protein
VCGSSWAIVAADMASSARFRSSGLNVALSIQQLISCAGKSWNNNPFNRGCNGGSIEEAYKYIHSKGLATENSYPYTDDDVTSLKNNTSPCLLPSPKIPTTNFINAWFNYENGTMNDEIEMLAALKNGPISAVVDVNIDWNFYPSKAGVFKSSKCDTEGTPNRKTTKNTGASSY